MAVDDACKLFVAGLPESITEAVLQQLFEAAGGNVVEISLPRDRATGRPRGFGFVTLSSEQEARAARQSLDGSMQSGRSISVRPFQAGPRRPDARPDRPSAPPERGGRGGGGGADDRTLYLGNLPYDATTADVEAMLDQAGISSAVRVNLPLDPNGRPRGFGFVTLSSPDAAETAVALLREAELKGRRISASIAHGRGDRPARPPHSAPRTSEIPPSPRPDSRRFAPRDGFESAGGPPPDPGGGSFSESEEEGDGRGRGRRKVAKGKKKGSRGQADRGRTRRENEGLRAPRARDWLDDEDD
jgi:RNA recognition motif-containing protein